MAQIMSEEPENVVFGLPEKITILMGNRLVAQLAEQWTENLVFVPRSRLAPSHGCEHE